MGQHTATQEPPLEDVFLPFIRTDKFGLNGEVPQPVVTRVLLALSACTILPLKLFGALACLISFHITCRLAWFLPSSLSSYVVAELGKLHCRACLFCLGFASIRWVSVGSNEGKPRPAGVVSNHLGWADILIHMSRSFPSFVARNGTQNIPLVGYISQKMDCIYVEREAANGERGGTAAKVKERMLDTPTSKGPALRPMLLFPEGTTTNGHYLLPFKTGAFLAGRPLQPVIIEYGPAPVSPCWESIKAKAHLFLVLTHIFFTVTCYELPIYEPSEAEQKDPALFAANVRQYMLEHSRLQPSTATLEDKRRYHQLATSPQRANEQAPDKKDD